MAFALQVSVNTDHRVPNRVGLEQTYLVLGSPLALSIYSEGNRSRSTKYCIVGLEQDLAIWVSLWHSYSRLEEIQVTEYMIMELVQRIQRS